MSIVVFQDSFTEASNITLASHVPEVGSGWASYVTTGGANTIQVDAANDRTIRLVGSTSDGVIYVGIQTPIFRNMDVSATISVAESLDDTHYLAARAYLTEASMYILRFNASTFRIGKYVNAVFTWLTADLGAGIVADGNTVMLRVMGNDITAFVNGVQQLTVSDTSLTGNGFGGMGMGQIPTAGDDMDTQAMDNFLVEAYGGKVLMTMDAIIMEVHTTTFTADGIILATNTLSFTVDAIVKLILTSTFTVDGIIFARSTSTFDIDGMVLATTLLTFTIDGDVLVIITKTFTMDAIVSAPGYAEFTISASVIGEGFYLNSDLLKRPTTFSREYIFQKTDYTTLIGKTVRDTSSRKQKYMLGYERLTKTQVDALLEIINLNVAVQFQVRGQAFSDINTYVFPYIGSVTYDIVGSDYLASLQLELIEEQ